MIGITRLLTYMTLLGVLIACGGGGGGDPKDDPTNDPLLSSDDSNQLNSFDVSLAGVFFLDNEVLYLTPEDPEEEPVEIIRWTDFRLLCSKFRDGDPCIDNLMSISPNGEFVAFIAPHDGIDDSESDLLLIFDQSGSDPLQIRAPEWPTGHKLSGLTWSNDSTQIHFRYTADSGEDAYYIASINAAVPTLIEPGFDFTPFSDSFDQGFPYLKVTNGNVRIPYRSNIINAYTYEYTDLEITLQDNSDTVSIPVISNRDDAPWIDIIRLVFFNTSDNTLYYLSKIGPSGEIHNTWKLHTLNLTSNEKALVDLALDDFNLNEMFFATDNTKIAIRATSRETPLLHNLYLFDINSGEITLIDETIGNIGNLVWSADGEKIAYNTQIEGIEYYKLNYTDGRSAITFANDDGLEAVRGFTFSPDSQWLSYMRQDEETAIQTLFLINTQSLITETATSSNHSTREYAWSPNSEHIAMLNRSAEDEYIDGGCYTEEEDGITDTYCYYYLSDDDYNIAEEKLYLKTLGIDQTPRLNKSNDLNDEDVFLFEWLSDSSGLIYSVEEYDSEKIFINASSINTDLPTINLLELENDRCYYWGAKSCFHMLPLTIEQETPNEFRFFVPET